MINKLMEVHVKSWPIRIKKQNKNEILNLIYLLQLKG